MKGADLITEFLVDSKIPYVFGICGHGNVGMLDSLYASRDRIKLVSPRHEQVAGHMADAYFRVRHEAVATLTSCGPGSCNIVMPLACAISDSSALLAITANVPTGQFNRSPFQEINKHFQADFPNIIRPVVKRSFQPTRVDMRPLGLRQATTTMLSGRPGPVNVDVPFNVFQEEDDVEVPKPAPLFNTQRSGASPEEIAACVDLILKAKRPVLFVGHGVTLSEASRELTEFAHRLQIQEKLTAQIANTLQEVLQPRGVAVVIEAAHQCMTTRGVLKSDVTMVTSRMLGAFRDNGETRREFLTMIGRTSII